MRASITNQQIVSVSWSGICCQTDALWVLILEPISEIHTGLFGSSVIEEGGGGASSVGLGGSGTGDCAIRKWDEDWS